MKTIDELVLQDKVDHSSQRSKIARYHAKGARAIIEIMVDLGILKVPTSVFNLIWQEYLKRFFKR